MRSSYRLFSISGISVELHFTFILLLLFFMVSDIQFFSVWVLVFGVVLVHELFHSFVALRFGISVPRIILTPIGGISSIDVPEKPAKEFLISVAGPASNLLMASAAFLAGSYLGVSLSSFLDYSGAIDVLDASSLLVGLFWVNLMLGAFNMLPGFPMDGGRVFRAFLAFFLDYIKATEVAVYMGRIIAILFFLVGLSSSNLGLVVISFFLFFSGGQELEILRLRHMFHGMKARDVAVSQMRYVNEHTSIKDFMELVSSPDQEHYPVTEYDGRIIGVLRIQAAGSFGGDAEKTTARDLADKRIDSVPAESDAEQVLLDLLAKEFVLVVDEGRVLGYVTPKTLMGRMRR